MVYRLWESSWEDDALLVDRTHGIYADPEKVHDIAFVGEYFSVPGKHLVNPSPQRTPVIFQAGASARGGQFAARHGEGIFINGMRKDIAGKLVAGLRGEAERQGRPGGSLKIMQQMTVIVADSDAAAER